MSEAVAERIAGKLVDASQHGQPTTAEEEEPSGSPSERVKVHNSADVKDWFLDLRDLVDQCNTTIYTSIVLKKLGVSVRCPLPQIYDTSAVSPSSSGHGVGGTKCHALWSMLYQSSTIRNQEFCVQSPGQ